MLLPFYILFVEGIIPIIIKLYLTLIPYELIFILLEIICLIFTITYISLFKLNDIKEGYINLNYKIIIIIIIISFFGTFLGKIFFIKTIKDNDNISIFVIIMSLYPMVTIISSYFLLNERISNKQLLGYFLIIIGIYFLLYKSSKSYL
jgi:drug/metabolite transporter (DMT)-like permease